MLLLNMELRCISARPKGLFRLNVKILKFMISLMSPVGGASRMTVRKQLYSRILVKLDHFNGEISPGFLTDVVWLLIMKRSLIFKLS